MARAGRLRSACAQRSSLPSHFEIDDAFATADEMGARVVRSQTMGDTVGCPLCIEPEQGKFNEAGFQASDYAIRSGREASYSDHRVAHWRLRGLRRWRYRAVSGLEPRAQSASLFTDPKIIAAFEQHIDTVLNRRNRLPAYATETIPP